jgi:hypothetical protein
MGLLIDKKQKHKFQVHTEKVDEIGARLEYTSRKSLEHLAQETGVSKSSARMATQLLKLRPYKTTIIHTTCILAIQQQGSFLQLVSAVVVEGEVNPQLAFLSDEARFHLQGYINTQNNIISKRKTKLLQIDINKKVGL